MKISNKALKRRIVEISYKYRLSHLGSCLTAVDIIYEIYMRKRAEEKFILSSGHAGLALYVVLESRGGKNAERIYKHHGTHPDWCGDCGLDCSTGSLGQGLPIAIGMALADRSKKVYCLISDGECAEGSIWECALIREKYKIDNLKIYLNYNGFGAYDKTYPLIKYHDLFTNLAITNVEQLPFLKGQAAHYHVMSKEDYKQAMEILK